MERGPASMGQLAGGGAQRAPAAASPGRGTGNIPYARGMTSGQFGSISPQPKQQDQAVLLNDMPAATPPGGGPPMEGGSPAPVPMGPGMQQPFLDPAFYFDVMAAIMGALTSAADSDTGFY